MSDALKVNCAKARNEGLDNLSFVNYDGVDFPFEEASFDIVVTRYALHHFPDIDHSIHEVSRVLRAGGRFFLSDPRPNKCDRAPFLVPFLDACGNSMSRP